MESKNNNSIIVTVLLVIIIIGLIGFILYDKVLKKDIDTNNTTSNVEENNNKEDNLTEEEKEISVVDAVNYSYNIGWNINNKPKINVRLPRIEGNTKTINEMNKQILNEILPRIDMYTENYYTVKGDTDSDRAYKNGATVTYEYKIQNNILVINIFDELPIGSVSAGASVVGYYLYDIEDDKIPTVKEAAKKLGLEEEYNELKIETFKDFGEYLPENGYVIYIEEDGLRIGMAH